MMKSMYLMRLKHSGLHPHTMALAHRALLLLFLFLMSLGNVCGQEYEWIELMKDVKDNNGLSIDKLNRYDGDLQVRFTFTGVANGGTYNGFGIAGMVTAPDTDLHAWNQPDTPTNKVINAPNPSPNKGTVFYVTSFKVKDLMEVANNSNNKTVYFRVWNYATLDKVEVNTPQDSFSGELPDETNRYDKTKKVSRFASSVTIDVNIVDVNKDLATATPKYARLYLTDANGDQVDPTGKLTVKYGNDDATPCPIPEKGFYIYPGEGANLTANISVRLASPKAYKLYKVVCLFSNNEPEMKNDKISTEPNFNLQYTYSFEYNSTTKEINDGVDWRDGLLVPTVLSGNPDTDWDISWEELAVSYYVKWHVEDESGNQVELMEGNSRQNDNKWAFSANDYTVAANAAVLEGSVNLDADTWETYKTLTFYVPEDKEYASVNGYKIICEIYANSEGTGSPNARYTFSLRDFLGELDPDTDDRRGGMTMDIKKGVTSLEMELEKVALPNNAPAKYARIWLTTTDGTMIDPTGKLLIEGMTPYVTEGNTDVRFGYYLADKNGVSLKDIKDILQLPLGTYDQYQVHVALSKDGPTIVNGEITHEPNYDYVYTLGFTYPVKTKYKTLVYNATTRQCRPILLKNWMEVAGDCGEGISNLKTKLYVRWYLATISTVDGKEVETPINFGGWTNNGYNYQNAGGTRGYYGYGRTNNFIFEGGGGKNNNTRNESYRPTITLPTRPNNNYNDVRLICIATTKTDNYTYGNSDPEEIQVKYVYTLKTANDLRTFAHYEGEAYRYLKEIGYDDQAKDYDYIEVDGSAPTNNYTWNISTNGYNTTPDSRNIRQNVHVVDYYYYVSPGTPKSLLLPLQFYQFDGQETEPMAYYRWYDYKTDASSNKLTTISNSHGTTKLGDIGGRGLFAINKLTSAPRESFVGVNFTASQADFNSEGGEFLIACDVSRYFDGMDESFTYFVHEPTLSIRYVFHIRPASAIATEISDKANANSLNGKNTGLAAVEEKITNLSSYKDKTISILENEGRIVVSTNNGVGHFSLRTQLSDVSQYYINSTTPAQSLWWYAYYKDDEGNWWKHLVLDRDCEVYVSGFYDNEIIRKNRSTMNQGKYSLQNDFNTGTWTQLTGSGGSTPTIKVGDCVQMVGCVSTGTSATNGTVMPIIWTELEFIDAMPLRLDMERSRKERTATYMTEHYGEPTVLNFNDFSLLGMRKPTHSYENYATVPLHYPNAQYGFSYPQLYGLCATSWYCSWDGYGIDPMHGDYLLLKSMGMTNVSANETWEQGIWSNWWYSHEGGVQDLPDYTVLLDVTHEREHPSDKLTPDNTSDSDDYGGFLYVDAADEARTIASLEFTDSLCADAKIYYTAYVASVCGRNYPRGWAQTPPMLRFRVTTWDDEQGKYVPVVTFVTGDIKEEINLCGCDNCKCLDSGSWNGNPCACGNNCKHTFKNAHWYQVYGYTTIPSELNYLLDGSPRTYHVEIDNYCDNTDGADYCVDEISFYRNNAKLSVIQSAKRNCDDKGAALNIYVSDKELQYNGMAGKPIYWRICNSDGTPVMDETLYGDFLVKSTDGTPYGMTTVPQSYNKGEVKDASEFGEKSGYFSMESNGQTEYYFSLANKLFELLEGANYHISVFQFGLDPNDYENGTDDYDKYWGKLKDACSVYSPVFVPKMMYVSISGLDGESNPSIEVGCPDHKTVETEFEILLNIPNDDSGFQSYKGVSFDYYIGTKKDLQEEKYGEGNPKFSLEDAVKYYRNYDRSVNETTITWDPTYVGLDPQFELANEAYYQVLKDSVEAGVLHLACSSKIKLVIDADHATLWAMATAERYEGNLVCTPLPLVFNVIDKLEDPSIMLGFEGVTYRNNPRVVRVGKKQLINMQKATDGYLLHIPVNDFKANKDKDEEEDSQNPEGGSGSDGNTEPPALGITSGFLTLLANGTDDPTITKDVNVATFDGKVIDKDRMYISFNFHGVEDSEGNMIVPDTLFHEGYTYRMFFQVKNNAKLNDPAACKADVEFLMKVVPEYVTWNDGSETGEETVTGTNQNENTNWNNDKNWSRSQKAELHKTATHNTDNYKNNDEIFSGIREDYKGTPATFVPMKFTYVTIPSGNKAPQLVELTRGDGEIINGTSINYNDQLATDSIQFDMMVMIDEQTECEHDGVANPRRVYEVEKFYGNTCKQIYFKPGAELVYQQFLTYGKAWVEKTLKANRWYLMSTPLKNTYAGDMFVPSVDGQQTTEAFRDIEFNTTTYSRTAYPIYQRSWGTAFGSKVYVAKNSSYDAGLSHGSVVESTMAEWGHTFNDVQVPYTNRTAFAIRAHKKDQTVSALFRLPKEDRSYSYYGYNGTAQGSVTVSKDATGKFITDVATPAANATVTIEIDSLQQQRGYILVGNPYMASLDMSKFIKDNEDILDDAYYTYGYDEDDDVYKATTHGVGDYDFIRPLEAFFVKLKSDATSDIVFTDAMMIDGNTSPIESQPAPALILTASNGRGQSSATLSVGEEARSVETLFDSNLEDVPMVYTVADGQAVSIHQLTELDRPIAFGVTCAASDETVEVTFTDVAQLTTGDVFVVDAVTGSQTAVGEGSVLGIQPNDYGRYFLLAGTTTIGSDRVDVQKGIVVSVRGKEVTITSGEELTQVRALSLSGASVYQDAVHGLTTSFTLSSGVYIIQAENVAGEQQTVKVVVR